MRHLLAMVEKNALNFTVFVFLLRKSARQRNREGEAQKRLDRLFFMI